MLNHITLMGRLTHAPELRRTESGISVAGFSLAVSRDFTDSMGKRETDFIDCVAWRSAAEFLCKSFAKGQLAVVDGRLQIRNYLDRDGNRRRQAEVVVENLYFAGGKREAEAPGRDMTEIEGDAVGKLPF